MQVITTNEAPSSSPIEWHHELAHYSDYPSHILFYCQISAEEGGSTPIISSDYVYNYMNTKYPEFVKKVESLGLRYVRIVPE